MIDLGSLVKNPVFVFVTGAVGGVCGTLIKGWADIWTSEAKRRQDSVTHFFAQIELLAPSYYLMSNHASLLSWRLGSYLQLKRELQMTLLDPDQTAYKLLKETAENTAAEALFEAGKVYRVITDRFLIQGGVYVVPDQWAGKALDGLHDQLMALLIFDDNVLLKHIGTDTQRPEFLAKLKSPEWDHRYDDLRGQYSRYQDWLQKQEKDVKLLALNARAYSNLFNYEMRRLYKDVWRRTPDDPLEADEVTGSSSGLPQTTRNLIKKAAEDSDRSALRLAGSDTNDPDATLVDAFLSVGWSYYDANQWDLAIGEFKKAIARCHTNSALAKSPSHAAAYNSLGNGYTRKGDFASATSAYQQASVLEPRSALIKRNHGRMQIQQAQAEPAAASLHYGLAASLFREAVELGAAADQPDDRQQAQRYSDLGSALSYLKQWPAAIEAYGRAIVLQPLEAVLYAYLAETYEGEYDDTQSKADKSASQVQLLTTAAAEYAMAVSLSTGENAAAYERSMATTYKKAALWEDSAAAYRRALAACTTGESRIQTLNELGQMYQQQGQWISAAENYDQALQIGGDTSSLLADNLIYALEQSGAQIPAPVAARAIRACQSAIAAEPDERTHHARLANIYLRLQDYPHCLEERDEVVRLAGGASDREMAGYLNQLALAYRKLNISDMALDYYQRAIKLDPRPEYLKNQGLYLQALRRFDEARPLLEQARANGFKDDFDVLLSLAMCLAYGSNPDIAAGIGMCRSAGVRYAESPLLHSLLGELLVDQGKFSEGADEYRRILELKPTGNQRAEALQSGIAAYSRAIPSEPARYDLHYWRAWLLAQSGDSTAAEAGYIKAQELAGDRNLESISIQNSLAGLLYARGDYDGARTCWETAQAIGRRLSPAESALLPGGPLGRIDLEQITNNLGTAYDGLAKNESDNAKAQDLKKQALDCYRDAALNSPKTFVAHYNLARALYQQQQFDMALSQFQEALRLMPPASLAQKTVFNIGNCYYRLSWGDLPQKKWDEAAAGPDFAEAHYNLGIWYWQQNQPDKAETCWNKAVQIMPSLLDAEFNLGMLSLSRGNTADAIAHWQKIAADPGFGFVPGYISQVQNNQPLTVQPRDIREI